jgi:hypothetical protein
VYLYFGSATGLLTKPVWTETGEPGDRLGVSVTSAGDFNNDGINDIVIGSPENNDIWFGAGKISLYSLPEYFNTGIYESPVFSSNGLINLRWLSLAWEPLNQPESTSVWFQIGTSSDGLTWNYAGPQGNPDDYFKNPRGQPIGTNQLGTFWKYRAYLETWDKTVTPTVESVTVNFGYTEETSLYVKVTSPNGGEDWMKDKYYPITWDASGDLNSTPISLYYTTDLGGDPTNPNGNWTLIAQNVQNIGLYNWTVPNIETANAIIAVMVTDIYGNYVVDTSDASFAIDPPPAQSYISGTETSSDDEINDAFNSILIDDVTDEANKIEVKTNSDENDLPWLAPILLILTLIILLSVGLNLYLINSKRTLIKNPSKKNEKQIVRIDELLKNKRR